MHLAALDTPAVATVTTTMSMSMLIAHISWRLLGILGILGILAMLNAHISWHSLGIPREVEAG